MKNKKTVGYIIETVREKVGGDPFNRKRKRENVFARRLIIYYIKLYTRNGTVDATSYFGLHHSAASFAIKKLTFFKKHYEDVNKTMNVLEGIFNENIRNGNKMERAVQ